MRFDEIRALIERSRPDEWALLGTAAPPYIHRVQYGRDEHGERIFGIDEHLYRAVLRDDIDVGLVWGMALERNLDFGDDWGPKVGSHQPTVAVNLIEILYRGQPVDRVEYYKIDNHHGSMPIPHTEYKPDTLGEMPEIESQTVDRFELHLVALTDGIAGGGAHDTPENYVARAGFTVV